jgi:hypothetical protein
VDRLASRKAMPDVLEHLKTGGADIDFARGHSQRRHQLQRIRLGCFHLLRTLAL